MIKYTFFIIFLFISCKNSVDVTKYAEQFSELECKAITLKDKRYALADRLREIELDSINNRKELDSLKKLVIITKKESLALADSIKHRLNDLFVQHLKDPDDRKKFNDILRKIILAKGCIQK